MPPKAKPAPPSKKTEAKKKEKTIEDKTFGLKNKKGAKQQKFIQQVEKQVKSGGTSEARKLALAKEIAKKKDDDSLDITDIFKPVTQAQKVEKGADPKSVLCAFFKQGSCTKGDKCKFSHDLTIERKAEKRSLYCDMRDDEAQAAADTMDQWDVEKLKQVVEQKHGESDRSKPKTDIICKFFLDAVERSKYGWFWECPNGKDCHYRHALPSGFLLKKDKKKEEKKDEISLEDLIERERAALGSVLTKVTLVTFIAWKKRKLQEKKETIRKDEEKKRADFKAGRQIGLSGREMFTFNPEMAADGDQLEDGDDTFDTRNLPNDDQDANEYKEIAFDQLEFESQENDGSGTQATIDRFEHLKVESGPSSTKGACSTSNGAGDGDVPIDEDLFEDSDVPDSDEDDE